MQGLEYFLTSPRGRQGENYAFRPGGALGVSDLEIIILSNRGSRRGRSSSTRRGSAEITTREQQRQLFGLLLSNQARMHSQRISEVRLTGLQATVRQPVPSNQQLYLFLPHTSFFFSCLLLQGYTTASDAKSRRTGRGTTGRTRQPNEHSRRRWRGPRLRNEDLPGNSIGDEGAKALGSALRRTIH